jgi:hypothetical protein
MNIELIAYVEAEIQRLRALEGPCARFVANQLERTHQLLIFTAAETAEQFYERIECNEEWVREEAYNRGYQEGRSSVCFEVGSSFHIPN